MRNVFFPTRSGNARRVSGLAMAVALATGGALTATALEAPAAAQKRDKKQKDAKQDFSKEFMAVYQPAAAVAQEGQRDVAAMQAAVPQLVSVATTADDKFVAGNYVYQTGISAQDPTLQAQGVELMLESGKVPAENLAQYNFLAGQLAYQAENWDKARRYVQAAIDAGYTQNNPRALIAESYFAEDRRAEGVNVLKTGVEEQISAGQTPDRDWLRRGLSQSFQGELPNETMQFGRWYAQYYPSDESWGDAIVTVRNFNQFNDAQMLDLLRLQRATGTFRQAGEYKEYVDTANPRRLPGEVVAVIDEGYASGLITRDDAFLAEMRAEAAQRVEADRADLPEIERDARSSGAQANSVIAAADAFLNYDEPAKAEEFYRMALDMPGTNRSELLTRIGIALVQQGQFAEAQDVFGQVDGVREPIADLWAIYAMQQANGMQATGG